MTKIEKHEAPMSPIPESAVPVGRGVLYLETSEPVVPVGGVLYVGEAGELKYKCGSTGTVYTSAETVDLNGATDLAEYANHALGTCWEKCGVCAREVAVRRARIEAIDPALRRFALESWTDEAKMEVLLDRLLEDGLVIAEDVGVVDDPADVTLLQLETKAREWILTTIDDVLELRTSGPGPWPNMSFVVYRNHAPASKRAEATLSDVVRMNGVRKQPRLLRSPTGRRS